MSLVQCISNVCGRRSVIVDGEVVLVKDSENIISTVLRNIGEFGNHGNYSLQSGSLQQLIQPRKVITVYSINIVSCRLA